MASKKEKQKAKKGFRIFLKYVLKYKRTLVILSVFSIIMAIIDGSVPFVSGKFFDAILKPDTTNFLFLKHISLWAFYLGIWLALQLLTRVFTSSADYVRMNFKTVLSNEYVLEGVKKVLRLPLRFHKDNKLGNTIDRIQTAASRLNGGMEFATEVSAYMLGATVGIIFVFSINYVLGIVMSGIIIAYVLVMLKIMSPLGDMEKKGSKMYSDSYGDMYDALGNIKLVKQNGAEEFEVKKFFSKFISGAQGLFLRVNKIQSFSYTLQGMAFLSIQFSFFLISVYYIRFGQMTLGELFAVNGYLMMAFWPFNYFVRWWDSLQKSFVALERAEKIFGHVEEIYDPETVNNQKKIQGFIEFKNATFGYEDGGNGNGKGKKTIVLKNVSFEVNRGETVAIVGESGVGKTTIADLISGFYFPQRGSILIDGAPTNKIPLKLLRRSIAVVSQDITIFNESIKYNIKYGNFSFDDRLVIKAAKEAGAHEFVSKFKKKYNQLVGERGVKLSGGQRQRVAIAQAILKNAPILILDEPTSALDARTEKLVTGSLEKLMKGRTTIIIAHRLSTVRKADKIIVLDKGRVVEVGRHQDLIKKKRGVYRKFYEVQKL